MIDSLFEFWWTCKKQRESSSAPYGKEEDSRLREEPGELARRIEQSVIPYFNLELEEGLKPDYRLW